jgi:hypothetical protein
MKTSQGIGNKLDRTAWRTLVTRRISALLPGQMRHSRMDQEDADDACSFLQAFNISTLDVPPGATPISGEAATPHAPLNLPKGGARTTAPGTDLPLVCGPRSRAAECWNSYGEVLPKHDSKSQSRILCVAEALGL